MKGFQPVSVDTAGSGFLVSAHGLPPRNPVFPTVNVLYLAYLSKSVNTGMPGRQPPGVLYLSFFMFILIRKGHEPAGVTGSGKDRKAGKKNEKDKDIIE